MFAVVSSGCGRDIPIVPVKGRVTFNGEPVERAEVCFIREAGTAKGEPAPPAIALTDAGGEFALQTGARAGAMPGQYRVTVQKTNFEDLNIPNPLPKPYRQKDIAAYMIANKLVVYQLLPQEYADMQKSPLNVEVTKSAADNNFDLELTGEPPKPPAGATTKR